MREEEINLWLFLFLFTNFLVHLVFLRQRTEIVLRTDVKKNCPEVH